MSRKAGHTRVFGGNGMVIKTILAVLLMVYGFNGPVFAQETQEKETQKHEISAEEQQELWKQPDFVRAYYVVVEPGDAMYSVFGHACFHMVCETYGLNSYYTYESEGAADKFFRFITGNLRMGMTNATPEEFLPSYEHDGRSVKEYELNLPIDVKRELWRVLDQRVLEGMDLSYDFESRGCAYACSLILNEALGETKIEYGYWSPRFNRTRREMCIDFAKREYPWDVMIMSAVVGINVDKNQAYEEKLVMPNEVAEVWQNAKVNGEYLLPREADEILPSKTNHKTPWLTPMLVAWLLLLLAIIALFIEKPWIDWLVLAAVTLIGVLETYLVVFSTLPCTNWNWLIVPFNMLPAILWKWRKYWSTAYAGIMGIWIAAMMLYPHQLVDNSMLVLVVAFMTILLNKRNKIEYKTSSKEIK